MSELRSVRIGDKVITVDGESPLRYVNMETNDVYVYPNNQPLKKVENEDEDD